MRTHADLRRSKNGATCDRPLIESVSVVPPFARAGWWGPDQCPQVRDDGGGATERGLSAFPRRALAHWYPTLWPYTERTTQSWHLAIRTPAPLSPLKRCDWALYTSEMLCRLTERYTPHSLVPWQLRGHLNSYGARSYWQIQPLLFDFLARTCLDGFSIGGELRPVLLCQCFIV